MDKKKKAAQLKKRIAEEHIKALEKFESSFTESVTNEVSDALECLERYKDDYFGAITQLMELDDSCEAIDASIQERIAMDDRCRHLRAFLRDKLPRESNPLNESTMMPSSSTFAFSKPNVSNLRFPKIDLPTFDGDYSKWLSFRDRFIGMIDASTELPSIAKLQYLLSSLKGEAAIPYEHTNLTADNYSVTWASLLKRYDNSRSLIREYYRKLHHFPAVQTGCVNDLAHLVDEFTRHVSGLVKLREPIESWDTPLSNLLLMKLDSATLLAWEEHSVTFDKDQYKDIVDFLHERIQILKSAKRFCSEATPADVKVAGNQRHPITHRKSITNAAATQGSSSSSPTSTTSSQPLKCPLNCSEAHLLRNCPAFLTNDTQQRRDIVKSKGLCWNCLSGSHQVKGCKSYYTCRSCHERHHTLLHQASQPKITMAAQSEDEMVFLETAIVYILDDYGRQHEARALLDSGSMSNFVSEALARKLMTTRTKVNVSVSGIGKAIQHVRGSITATVRSKTQHFATQLELLVLETPSSDIPTSPIDVSSWDMTNVTLADPTYHIPGRIDVVIGGDAFWELHTGHKRSLGPGRPWLVETHFGWAVAGNTSQSSHTSRICHIATNEQPLEAIMTRFWENETIPDDPVYSVEEDSCEKHYVSTTTRNASGRYVVCLPINHIPSIVLGSSREIAKRRFLAVERRLEANPQMKGPYSAFMKEYEKLGHMKKMPNPVDDDCPHYYLPHHAVLKEKSTSTKVRVVFDASCKTSTGVSLNDKLLVGPVIQQDLFTIMLRFRSHAIAITADVEKMYRQILHESRDRNFLRILYRENPNDPIDTYELQTVTYGTASAPFLATRTLRQIAQDHQDEYPRAANSVMNDFYMDDLLSGAEDLSDAIKIQREISAMLRSAGFVLKKWASNNRAALTSVPQEDLATLLTHEWQDTLAVSALGITWEPISDTFRCRVELPPVPDVLTKRITCSCIAKLFDPLGLIGPAILIGKLFMQQLWALKHDGKPWDWDRELPSSLREQWRKFHSSLNLLLELQVPRFISQYKATNVQLHIFADASQRAYGTCCYIRSETNHRVTVQLLAAKSKVVALANTHSIARLELCAARLATQLYHKVSRSLSIFTVTICWTDSMTVLYWLKSPPNRWKPFVANRIAKIQGETEIQSWKHVPGVDNPADDVSRGLDAQKLLVCQRWWHGPKWLAEKPENWPKDPLPSAEILDVPEERLVSTRIAAISTVDDFRNMLFSRFSSYSKLRRVMAYCMRYIHRLRDFKGANNRDSDDITPRSVEKLSSSIPLLTVEELQQAELRLCQLSQLDSFPDDLHNLTHGKACLRNSKLKWVLPFIDPSGTLRVGGRLRNADIPDATKHPILLDSKHPLASLLATAYHLQLLHAGPQLLLASLRQRFWIIGGRSLSKSVYHNCHACFKAKPTLVRQCVADLPSSRVSPTTPFTVCGVDYCGPVLLKATIRNRSPTKAYIAIFVCFATKAVHIELVGDLTTAAFLGALRRLIARRGRICELHSDNATTFKGASHELHRVYQMFKCNEADRAEIFNWCTNNELNWKFIPPRAPHFGGLWEAAVKSAKKHIIRSIGTISITQESMLTLLAQVEQCLNSRPLTPLSNDPSDLEPLTPAHFLIGRSLQAVPEVDHSQTPDNRLKEYQLVQKNVRNIWSRWMPEYLQQLQSCAKHCNGSPVTLKENQLVIIKEDNVHPTMWPMGRIVALHPGKDDVVRVVTLRTASGKQIVRPSVRLAILPIADTEGKSD